MTLLYSSLSKLFLLFLLSIWKPSTTNSTQVFTERAKGTILAHPVINSALEILDDDKLDKEWVIRNILGGMASGFGLRGVSFRLLLHAWLCVRMLIISILYSCTRLSSFVHDCYHPGGVGGQDGRGEVCKSLVGWRPKDRGDLVIV